MDPEELEAVAIKSKHTIEIDEFVPKSDTTRATMLRLLVEELNHLGHTREQLAKLDGHISRLSEITARHVELMDKLQSDGQSSERASMVLATYNDLMAVYIAHRQTITSALADGKSA
jgi:hypothetical protein